MAFWGYPRYVSVAEKKAKAAKKLKQLKKKRPNVRPVVLTGTTLARSWWAKSWNKNLERYADYENRIARGRSYVRHGAVLDLTITPGKAHALVLGSSSAPYEVTVNIDPIKKSHWQEIEKQCQGQLKSLQDLLGGKFPRALANIFFDQKNGLFPNPEMISFDCSCPDWASMCKHVAATLYGIGARFDEDSSLFFALRGVDTKDLIDKAVEGTADQLLAQSTQKSAKEIDNANLSELFGIDMDMEPDFSDKKITPSTKRSQKKQKSANTAKARHPKGQRRQKAGEQPTTAIGHVAALIAASKTGINVQMLTEKTGYTKTKIYGIVHQLKKQGEIKNSARGVYVKSDHLI